MVKLDKFDFRLQIMCGRGTWASFKSLTGNHCTFYMLIQHKHEQIYLWQSLKYLTVTNLFSVESFCIHTYDLDFKLPHRLIQCIYWSPKPTQPPTNIGSLPNSRALGVRPLYSTLLQKSSIVFKHTVKQHIPRGGFPRNESWKNSEELLDNITSTDTCTNKLPTSNLFAPSRSLSTSNSQNRPATIIGDVLLWKMAGEYRFRKGTRWSRLRAYKMYWRWCHRDSGDFDPHARQLCSVRG